jgi:hypothetical protein
MNIHGDANILQQMYLTWPTGKITATPENEPPHFLFGSSSHPILFPAFAQPFAPRGPNDVLRKHFRVTNADGTRILDEFRQRCLEAPVRAEYGGVDLLVMDDGLRR